MTGARGRRGASAVELALTLPVFLVCTVGAFDLAWLAFRDDTLALALDEACRTTALGDPTSDLEAALAAALDRSLLSFGLAACPECVSTASVEGVAPERRLVCGVSRTVTPLSSLVLGPVPLEAGTSAWMERQTP